MKTADEPLSIDSLISRFGDPVYRVAFGMTGNEIDATDVMTKTFAQILRSPHGVGTAADPTDVVYRVTIDESWKLLRRLAKRPWVNLDAIPFDSGEPGHLTHVNSIPRSNDPALADDAEARVAAAIQELPEGYREAVVLHDIDGLPYDVVARLMDLGVSDLKTRLNLARLYLRQCLLEPSLIDQTAKGARSIRGQMKPRHGGRGIQGDEQCAALRCT